MTAQQIEREVLIDAPVDRVWRLLTESEHLGTWFGDAGAEIDLRPGGAMQLSWTEYGTVHGRVERVEPQSLLAFRWAPFKEPAGEEPTDGNSTLVEFTLAADGDGTRLKVVESGFDTLATSAEQAARNRAGNVEGWELELGELGSYAARIAA